MSTTHVRSAECPMCQRCITLGRGGVFRQHGRNKAPCLGSRRTPEGAATLILPPLTGDQLAMIRECYRVGDWRPIELEFGIVFPSYVVGASTLDDELVELIRTVRYAITALVEASKAHASRTSMVLATPMQMVARRIYGERDGDCAMVSERKRAWGPPQAKQLRDNPMRLEKS
jgi:hypothetical protein